MDRIDRSHEARVVERVDVGIVTVRVGEIALLIGSGQIHADLDPFTRSHAHVGTSVKTGKIG